MWRNDQRTQQMTAGALWCALIMVIVFNAPFIVLDLVYAQEGSCSFDKVPGFPFTLSTWLEVDAYCRIAVCALFLLCAILACLNVDTAIKFFLCLSILLTIYSVFQLAWLIVGAIIFWGHLDKQGHCDKGITVYMYIVLILGFVGVCCNVFSANNRK